VPSALSLKLREALQAGDFDAAQSLVLDYGRLIEERLRAAATAQERQTIFDDAQETLTNDSYLVRVMRSHICADLQAVSGHMQYQPVQSDPHCWRMEG
jgi:hypothetical protein